jgi:hypothetical protein
MRHSLPARTAPAPNGAAARELMHC